jgi:DNA primase
MDCISVYLRGIRNVIATSGTAFTEQQVGLLRRHTTNIVVNFDPDQAGSDATEKSIALLTEEGFTIKIVTLDGGLDPDRFIRERGVEAYVAAIRGARSQADYLIERARATFPGASAEQKLKAMNYLLPHIRRMPEMIARDQFVRDASHQIGIDSAILREELRQAALRRRDRVEVRAAALTGVEKVLLRALAITDSEDAEARSLAVQAVLKQPTWFEHLGTFSAMRSLAARDARDPMDVVEDPAQRALLAESLISEEKPPTTKLVLDTLAWHEAALIEQELRKVRVQMEEATKKGDWTEALKFADKKIALDRRLAEIKKSGTY